LFALKRAKFGLGHGSSDGVLAQQVQGSESIPNSMREREREREKEAGKYAGHGGACL
jgi:hypothetical protein